LFTSGTTGTPKGAPLGHAQLGKLVELLGQAWQLSSEDVLVHALPLHHLHGLAIALLSTLLAGGCVELLPGFEPARVWNAFERATLLMGVPTMHRKLLDALLVAEPDERRRWQAAARRLRLVTSGSAALPVQLGERWRDVHGNYPLERFGMTEIGVGLSNPLAGERRPGSCGTPLPEMEVRIVDERGDDVGAGQSGELWIRGPTVFQGYDCAPEATRAAFAGDWFKSGDIGTWLDEGFVRILGRASVDIIKSGGYKLSALEIEAVLRDHPGVGDVAVVGLADEVWGEAALAAVVGSPMQPEPDAEALRAWLKERVAPYKVPRAVFVLEDLPRNALGKVNKVELAALLAARASPRRG
jgi:malonyl-CoA/methylmalonyl-CoA synthetase